MRYFVGTELGVANLLQRHFCWTSNSLWFEEIPNARDPAKTLFVLGGKDDIVHSEVSTSIEFSWLAQKPPPLTLFFISLLASLYVISFEL